MMSAKGMVDIFGGPSDVGMNLGMGPGVIGGPENGFGNRGGGSASFNGANFDSGRPSFEEKFRETNSNYNNSNQRERGESFKKRDSFESKFAERPDFGDRFTANRNKTHPSNRGGGRGDVRRESEPLRPSPNSMMLKPKTPFSLPKSAMAKLDGVNPVPGNKMSDKVMMSNNEPAVIIQKP